MPTFEPVLIVLILFYCAALLIYALAWRNTVKIRDSARKTKVSRDQILRETAVDIPDVNLEPSPLDSAPGHDIKHLIALCLGFSAFYLVLYFAIGVGVRAVLSTLDEDRQQLVDVTINLILPLVLAWIIFPLIARWLVFSAPERRLTRLDLQFLAGLTYAEWAGILVNFLTIPFLVVPVYRWPSAFLVYIVNCFVYLVFWELFKKSTVYFPQLWPHTALVRGDYEEAMQRIDHIEKKYGVTFITRGYQATILLFAGNYSEAEAIYRQILPEIKKRNQNLAPYLSNLGYTLLRQERYDEAIPLLQAAIKLYPQGGHAHSGLAEVYLYQGIEPQKTLDMMTEYLMRTPRNRIKDKTIWGAILGDRAWALAMLGRQTAAANTLKQAFEHTDRSSKYSLASLYFREGKIYTIQGETRSAAKSYQRAIELDPAGAYGQSSRQALAALHSSDKAD